MLDELNTIKFEENLTKEADLTPMYQITKLASDTYQVYSFENKSAEIINSKAALKTVASLRGGSYLSADLTKSITELDNFSSVVITADALKLSKTASVANNEEPWKLVSVNGVEYFVKATGADEEEEDTIKKTESESAALTKTASAKTHNYTIRINAHNIAEIGKIAGFAEEQCGAQPASMSVMPETNAIVFVVPSNKEGYEVQDNVEKVCDNNGVHLPQGAFVVVDEDGALSGHGHGCPCCKKELVDGQGDPDFAYQRGHQGMFRLETPEMPHKAFYADKEDTLAAYAKAHFTVYNIVASKDMMLNEPGTGIEHTTSPEHEESFAQVLASFLMDSDKRGFSKAAELVKGPDGMLYDTENPADAEQVKTAPKEYKTLEANSELGADAAPAPMQAAPAAPSNPADQPVQMPTEKSGETSKVVDPNEKPADETKQKGDNEVKRWKGMREDPSTGKYVVYITETEEHIYDNAEDAINFLVRK